MRKLVTKCKEKWKYLLKQKGQGLTEFVLVLAFCAVIGWIASEVGFMDAIGAVFDSGKRPETVTAAIGGGSSMTTPPDPPDPTDPTDPTDPPTPDPAPTYGAGVGPSGFDWGVIDPNEYYLKEYSNEGAQKDFTKEAAQADRLAADQKALENIGRYFIGKTKGFVTGLMKQGQSADMGKGLDGQEIHLGNFRQANENDPTSMVFVANRDMKGNGERGSILNKDGTVQKGLGNVELNNDIFKWMKNPYDPDSVEYDSDYNYLVSDYVVSQSWADVGGSDQHNGLRLRLEYDYTGKFADDPPGYYENPEDVKVIGAHVVLDAKSQNNKTLRGNEAIVDSDGKMKYNLRGSEGLDVQVRMNDDGEIYVTHFNTAREVTVANQTSVNNNVLVNWYGEGYYKITQNYREEAVDYVLTNTLTEYNVKRGDIFKAGNNYWIAVKDATLKLKASGNENSPNALEYDPQKQTPTYFVKFSGTNSNYWHENDAVYSSDNKTVSFDSQEHSFTKKTIMYRGTVMTMDNGDMYVYVGNDSRENDGNNVPFTGIDNINWIQIRGQREVLDSRLKRKAVTNNTDGSYPYGSYTPGAVINDSGTYKIVVDGSETDKWRNTVEYHIIDVAEHLNADGLHLQNIQSGDIVLTDNGDAYVRKYATGLAKCPPDPSDSDWIKIEF